jgi:hypothetical protein
MASSPETAKEGINKPAAAKDVINEKDPATALGEWYVPYMRYNGNKHLWYVSILSLTIDMLSFTIIDDEWTLKNSLVSQYAFFVAGVAGGTAYSVYRKPKNGLGIMMVTGAAGGLVDLAFGWNKACQPQVEAWKRHQQQYEIEKEAERRKS